MAEKTDLSSYEEAQATFSHVSSSPMMQPLRSDTLNPWGPQYQTNYGIPVIAQQPQAVNSPVFMVPDNMGLAIFATVCCWPIGLCAIMKASDARSALAGSDSNGALISANQSRRLSYISIIVGGILLVAFIIILGIFRIGR